MKIDDRLSVADTLATKDRWLEMQHLQAIEDNPLDAQDVQMFEMFERERWSHEQCLAYIREQALKDIAAQAAE